MKVRRLALALLPFAAVIAACSAGPTYSYATWSLVQADADSDVVDGARKLNSFGGEK